jgi:Skp family chaperone for outer membrane proteins
MTDSKEAYRATRVRPGRHQPRRRTQPAADVEKFRVDVQRFIEDARAELMGIQRDAESAFVVRLKPALAKVAQEKGLQIVLNVDDGQVAWFDPTLDITSDVVKQLANK